MTILLTGAAGFIGFHMCKRLLESGYEVVGLDNLNNYYAVSLKEARLRLLKNHTGFTFIKGSLGNQVLLENVFSVKKFSRVIHLAAQAGVRESIRKPDAYIDSNVVGFLNVLEVCRHYGVEHLIFASSSSVYGDNKTQPFSVYQNVDHPVSLYAATKKANELMHGLIILQYVCTWEVQKRSISV